MVNYDKIYKSHNKGVCETVVEQKQERLEGLWETATLQLKEMVVGFVVRDGIVEITGSTTGDKHSVSIEKIGSVLSEFTGENEKDIDKMGYIHTHPVSRDTMPNVMSPEDYNTHIKLCKQIDGFTTSLILTNINNQHILFGLDESGKRVDYENVQSDVARLHGNFLSHDPSDGNPFGILADMENIMLDNFEACSKRF